MFLCIKDTRENTATYFIACQTYLIVEYLVIRFFSVGLPGTRLARFINLHFSDTNRRIPRAVQCSQTFLSHPRAFTAAFKAGESLSTSSSNH